MNPVGKKGSEAPILETAKPGPIGGALNELGSIHRAGVGAYFVAHGLIRLPVKGLDLPSEKAVPLLVGAESDAPVDDLEVKFATGGTAFVQAKLGMTFGPSPRGAFAHEVLSQWIRQLRSGRLSRDDRLVLAVGEASQPLRILSDALSRRRSLGRNAAYSLSSGEADALNTLTRLLAGHEIEVETLLDRAVILRLHVLHEGRDSALATEQMLDGAVVPFGHGGLAFQVLRDALRCTAADRRRLDMEAWRSKLAAAPLQLRDRRPRTNGAERLERLRQRYFDRLAREGSEIQLTPIGIEMSPIRLEAPGLDLPVRPVGDPDDAMGTHDLAHVLRRVRRILLLGLPGSGKSTSLRQLAALAALDPHWPTPLLVRLDSIKDDLPRGDPLDLIVQAAMAETPRDERHALGEWLRNRVDDGRALLLLDGLDECRSSAGAVVASLLRVIQDAHEDLEVVVATRASTFSMGRTLGFPSFELRMPTRFGETLETFCEAMAWERDVPRDERQTWVDIRLAWEEEAVSHDEVLKETPLIRLLLLYLTRHEEIRSLPKRRADILGNVIDEAVERWELIARRSEGVRIGPFDARVAYKAILRGFEILAHNVFPDGSANREEAARALATMSNQEFGAPLGAAPAAADDIISFWDESSIFVLGDEGKEIRPRIRLFGEIGEARYIAALGESEISQAIVQHLGDPDRSEVVVLAACLDSRAAAALLDKAIEVGLRDPLFIAARALEEGAQFAEEQVQRLSIALRGLLVDEPWKSWEAAQVLTKLPLRGAAARNAIDDVKREVPGTHRDLATILGLTRWEVDDAELDAAFERVLLAGEPPRLHDPNLDRANVVRSLLTVDRGYSRALLAGASRILPKRPDLAPPFAEKAYDTMASIDQKEADITLSEIGRKDLLEARAARQLEGNDGLLTFLEVGQEGDARFLELLTELGSSEDLSWGQQRGLDELIALIKALDVSHSPAGWLPVATLRHEDDVRVILDVVTELADLEKGVIAAQAGLIVDRPDLDKSIWHVAQPNRPVFNWEQLEDQAGARGALIERFAVHPWFRSIAMAALWNCPARSECAGEIRLLLWHPHPEVRADAATLTSVFLRDDLHALTALAQSSDPHIRRQVGLVTATFRRNGSEDHDAIVRSLLDDDDLGVRIRVRRGLGEDPPGELRGALAAADAHPARGWRCRHCDAANPIHAHHCLTCNRGPVA